MRIQGKALRAYYQVKLTPSTRTSRLAACGALGITESRFGHEPPVVKDMGDYAVVRVHWQPPMDGGRFVKNEDATVKQPDDAVRFGNLSYVTEVTDLEAAELSRSEA